MKKIYQKPVTDTVLLSGCVIMQLGVGSGEENKTSTLPSGTEGDAPKRNGIF